MAVPTVMNDLSTTPGNNSPAGSESPISTDDFHRAIQAILRTTNAKGADIASASTTDIGAATGEFVDVTGTTTITALGTIGAGITRTVRFTGALTLTHNGTSLILPGSANITTANGDCAIFRSLGSGNWKCIGYFKQSGSPITLGLSSLTAVEPQLDDYAPISDTSDSNNQKKAQLSDILGLLRGYLDGFIMSTAGSSATMTIASGVTTDSTNVEFIKLSSSIAKTTSAWAVGTAQGGLDTGAIANNTWYHFYVIRRPDTGVVDVVFSTNASSPTLPTNYTQYRRIGSGRTNSSAQWVKFLQLGDAFYWSTPEASASNATVGASRTDVTTLTPLGVRTIGIYNVYLSNTGTSSLRLYGKDDDDAAISADNATLVNAASSTQNQTVKNVITNTSSQVSWRAGAAGTTGCYLQTLGYVDLRGKDA